MLTACAGIVFGAVILTILALLRLKGFICVDSEGNVYAVLNPIVNDRCVGDLKRAFSSFRDYRGFRNALINVLMFRKVLLTILFLNAMLLTMLVIVIYDLIR